VVAAPLLDGGPRGDLVDPALQAREGRPQLLVDESPEQERPRPRERSGDYGPAMIDLYYWPTPNGWKVSIMLEECGLPYRTLPVDIGGGDQFKPDFLRISPNNRMPAIVDHEPLGGGKPLSLFESGAILEYLADKTGKLLPRSGPARYGVLQWVHWQMANLGPMMGNANHFKNYAKHLVDDPAQLAYGTRRFVGEVDRLCGVMDAQLSAHRHLAGDDYTIADVIWES
jgi:GST-like protein